MKAFEDFKNVDIDYLVNDEPPQKYEASFNAERLYNQIIKLLNV
jgi:hypothetical protein